MRRNLRSTGTSIETAMERRHVWDACGRETFHYHLRLQDVGDHLPLPSAWSSARRMRPVCKSGCWSRHRWSVGSSLSRREIRGGRGQHALVRWPSLKNTEITHKALFGTLCRYYNVTVAGVRLLGLVIRVHFRMRAFCSLDTRSGRAHRG